ncbi:MAG: polysaccharide export protein [Nitrobacter sp.]|uniref:polysaccharide biosynthesis/export family protein n=1 Tax=Nitrobacter sp. TaxID=29420 RepID=UPI00387DDE25
MRSVRAITLCLLTALALSGCMRRPAPAAMVRPHNDLDALAYGGPRAAAPPPVVRRDMRNRPSRTAVPVVYAAPPPPVVHDPAYRLDAGDRLRIVVYGQEGLTNTYLVDAGGSITMPLIGAVAARGRTPAELSAAIAARLRNGYIREPYVAAEVEAYRPFFILGEVAAPGQYPFVPNMTAESAVAIAGGFSPRAKRDRVTLTHTDARGTVRLVVPTTTLLSPGDTVLVNERWF